MLPPSDCSGNLQEERRGDIFYRKVRKDFRKERKELNIK